MDKALLQVRLEALREAYEEYKEQAGTFGGPAVVEVFGERSVELVRSEACTAFIQRTAADAGGICSVSR